MQRFDRHRARTSERRSLGGHKSQERIDVTSRRIARRSIVAGLFALAVLVFPASALAHTSTATVSCTGADFSWVKFRPQSATKTNKVHWRLTVDGAAFQEGTFVLNAPDGGSGSMHVPYTLAGTHAVAAFSWWLSSETVDGSQRPEGSPALASQTVVCPTPPPTTPTTTTTTPPAAPPAAPVTTPASGVLGTQTRSAAARLSVPRSCASRVVRVRVSGRLIRRVTLSVNGRRVRTVNLRSTQRSVTVSVPLSRAGASRQTVRARFTFRNGTASRTLSARATRCAQAAVRPQFTG